MPEQQPRQAADADHVAVLAAAVLHGIAKDRHHLLCILLPLIKAVGHHLHQLLLLGVQQEGVDDAAADHTGGKGAADVVQSAQLKGAVDIGAAHLGGDHDGGHILGPAAAVHFLQHLKAVHLRHDDIQQQGGDLALVHLQRRDGLPTVRRLDDLEVAVQHIGQHGAVHLGIIRDQQLSSLHSSFPPRRMQPTALPAPLPSERGASGGALHLR